MGSLAPSAMDRLRASQHHSFQDHLPVAHRDLVLDLATDGIEVDGMEARARSALPEIGEAFCDRQGFELMCTAAEIAEHIVECDTPSQQAPRRDRRIETTGEQTDRATLRAEGKSASRTFRCDEVVGVIRVDFDKDRGFRI